MRRTSTLFAVSTAILAAGAAIFMALPGSAQSTSAWRIIAWNDLGMHCMDGSDFSVSTVLPPFNTIHAHLVDSSGKLVKSGSGITVTYQAVADATGSINKTSVGKTNFWSYAQKFFGVALAPDMGLKGYAMPGSSNTPRSMAFDSGANWFTAEGIPITPYDDQGRKNYYPMMRVSARNSSGQVLASTNIVLPVSDEMDCQACHLSNSNSAAKPAGGWVNFTSNPAKDTKLNVLKLHDERRDASTYPTYLSQAGYSTSGLLATVSSGTPVFCEKCHSSNALPGLGNPNIVKLTTAVHRRHTDVADPLTGLTMNDTSNRSACYRCHPGSATKCLRGVMGNSVASDGTMAMQCQSCHGSMSVIATPTRLGWLDEPSCQNCHTGTATSNNGQIRYTSAFQSPGVLRTAVNTTFATNNNVPAAGLNLYRFSKGHGGLNCESCHGSTHAEYPTSHANDNVQSKALQGHAGMLSECTACHPTVPSTVTGGPHGLHPIGQSWISQHKNVAETQGSVQCQACHGADYRGTALSRSQADRTLSTEFGTKTFWRGFQIGCYTCHNGPREDSPNPNRAPVVQNATLSTSSNIAASVTLKASDADGNPLTLRIVSQPAHGTVALNATVATYFPETGYTGGDTFTFAAWDGSTNSNLGSVAVTVR